MNARLFLGSALAGIAIVVALAARAPQAVADDAPPSPASPTPSSPSASPEVSSPAAASASAPAASATPLYTFVYRASPQPMPPVDAPAIAEIDLNATELTPPAPLHVRVLTSVAVVSVTAQTSMAFMTRGISIPKAQPGLFLFDGYVPEVPFFLRNHTFTVDFIATAANGRTVDGPLPLRLD